jgi:hypothetical protein
MWSQGVYNFQQLFNNEKNMFFPSRFTFFIVVVREGKERKQGFFY